MAYRSLILQTLHYLSRPHERVPREAIESAAAWRADELGDEGWRESFDAAEIGEVERAIAVAQATGRAMADLGREDFPLPRLERRIDRWREVLARGRGVVIISGLPAQRWPQSDLELFFWGLGLHLGIPGAQNPQGDLLGHVRDQGVAPGATVRQYRTNEAIDAHCDAADVVGLLCVRAAKQGGLSRLASSVTVYNEILARRPDLVDVLYDWFQLDTRSEGGLDILPVIPCRYAGGQLRTFFHGEYYRSAPARRGGRPLTPEQIEVLDLYNEILAEPGVMLEMHLSPGDIQLVSNHTIVHSRTAYEDHDDPALRRHLLRLWLSLEEDRSVRWRLRKERARLDILLHASRHWLHRLRDGSR